MYRAWDKLSKKMLTGEQLVEMGIYISPANGNLLFPDDCEIYLMKYLILMKDTGLKDKNGKEIYEGDLIAYVDRDKKNYQAFEVFFHDNDYADNHIGYQINRVHNQGNICGGYIPNFLPKITKKMEIIGNIYANPELLKEVKK